MEVDTGCIICGHRAARILIATEKWFDLRGDFEYRECAGCGSLALINVPGNMSVYYPADKYYSLAEPRPAFHHAPGLKRWIAYQRNNFQLFGKPFWAAPLVARRRSEVGDVVKARFLQHLPARAGLDMRILDVGCGGGFILAQFDAAGFANLNGIDPYLPVEEKQLGHARLRRCTTGAIAGEQYDLITCLHVLEHLGDQLRSVAEIGKLLAPGGVLHIEVPVAECDAFREYQTDWIELDAPRHLFLHSRQSLALLAKKCDLRVVEMAETGTSFEFWGSEMYRRGIPFYSPELKRIHEAADLFSPDEIKAFEQRSKAANAAGRGGRVAITLQK